MILTVSRRTDIPCCYPEWFMNRIREGQVCVRNPMNHAQISRIYLTPDVVDCIVFWTKDPSPLMNYLDELEAYGYRRYYFQFTLTPYDSDIERNLRKKEEIIRTFQGLSQRIGRRRVVWRYDPIILHPYMSIEGHKERFEYLCEQLSPHTDTVTISFVDLYRRISGLCLHEATKHDMEVLSRFIAATAKSYGLCANACCERTDLQLFGIDRASCIDRKRIEDICGQRLKLRRDAGMRDGCGCFESIDIGAYNTCQNGCVYCYATTGQKHSEGKYDAYSPILCDTIRPYESIRDRKVATMRESQLSFLD